jgi:hypothetical protein
VFGIPEKVDILICPSKLSTFSGEIACGPFGDEEQGTLCLSPGLLGQRVFAKIEVFPGKGSN